MPRTTADLLDELFAFIRIPSISSGDGDAGGPAAGGRLGRRPVRDAGGTAEVLDTAKNPLAVGRVACGRAGAPHILLYGHYDVQTVAPLAAWDSPPFEPEVRDGYVYGRGASDDKGNFHCLLAAAVDLARAGELQCDLTIVSDGEEEIGGDSVVRWLDAEQPSFDAAVVFDSALVEPGWPLLTIGVRGVITGSLRVTTGTRDVHSGMYGGAALNAAHVLATLIDGTRARDGLIPDGAARRRPAADRRRGGELGHAAVRRTGAGSGRDRAARRRRDRRLLPAHVRAADVRRERDHVPRRVAAPHDHPVRGDRGDLAAAGARPAGRYGMGGAPRPPRGAEAGRSDARARAVGQLGRVRVRPGAAAAADRAARPRRDVRPRRARSPAPAGRSRSCRHCTGTACPPS